ncbi:MAG: hypothetical protein JSR91_28225 [Proteobacteria bacterium]|nr:hypothetical protein [Pseudomonadota bacterium]
MQRRSLLAAPTMLLTTKAFARKPARTLRAVMPSGPKTVEPILTTAYLDHRVHRPQHGYMIYDTLFARSTTTLFVRCARLD